jgi:hypothetical protein
VVCTYVCVDLLLKLNHLYTIIFIQKMELPDDVLAIIREYSRPITRPDWRTLHRMPDERYFEEFVDQYIARATYINNHPERENPLYMYTLFRYKHMFSGFRLHCTFYQN